MNRRMQWTSSYPRSWLRLLTCGCVTAAALIGTARADDSEIYIAQSRTAPNIMLVLDTSGSMSGQVTTQEAYNPATDYVATATGSCTGIAGRVYFKTGSDQGIPPGCGSTAYVSAANMRCTSATSALASTAGSYQGDRFTQWRRSTRRGANNDRTWRTLTDNEDEHDKPIDCRNDNDTAPYPDRNASATNDTPAYTNTANDSIWTDTSAGTSATLYSANYVAYYAQFRTARLGTRLEVMQQAATTLLNAVSNVNVGLMRYSVNTTGATTAVPTGNGGGMVVAPIAPIAQNRSDLIGAIDAFIPDGNTPLSETLYEAHQYFSGGSVFFGDHSQACLVGNANGCTGNVVNLRSVASSRVGGTLSDTTYSSPATESCQKNYIVYLTDGEPTSDSKANSRITGLPDFATLVPNGCLASGQGRCLGALTEYMFDKDLRGGVSGEQNVTTYYIGFGDAFGSGTSNAAFQFLADAAARGGGAAYQAGDLTELTQVFNNIFSAISSSSSTMTAPTVAVNAFNRTRTLDDLYIAVFQPSAGRHWPGNIKKYQVDDDAASTILARGDVPAISAAGTFLDSTSDYWSQTNADGARVKIGGAARRIPAPTSRNLYTYIGSNNPRAVAGVTLSNVHVDNTAITDAMLGTNATANPLRAKLLNWARGADVDDIDEDNDAAEARFDMGDPMHSQPAVVIYGGTTTAKNEDDAVVFTATNDGYVHAFQVTDGVELWSFVPQEMLPGLKALYENANSTSKTYSIDGDMRVLKYDTNGDGVVNPSDNDRVLLFFSTGRNPTVSRYYAFDVTAKSTPRFLWSIGATELEGMGQAWSRPSFTRVNINGATQNSQKLALVFGGGYDPLEEGGAFVRDTEVGNRMFIVDALYGTLLWTAGDTGKDLNLARMTHSIPASINVVDLDGDGFADRMYAADTGAQLWRFDVFNGSARDALVTGGVIASLGAKDEATVTSANTRRFYNAPDSALLRSGNSPPFINITVGSGYRGHPLAVNNEDRFYAIRDYRPFSKLTQEEYGRLAVVTDAQLDDITTNLTPTLASNSPGWKLQLNYPSYRGEKVLSSATTLQNTVFFTTYTPSASASSNTCSVAVGSNRAYAISALDGRPLPRRQDTPTDPTNPNPNPNPNPRDPTREDRFEDLGQTGVSPEVTLLFPDKDKVVCLAGVEVLDICRDFNSRIKTYWRQTNAN